MNSFDAELSRRLEQIRRDNLYRELRRVDSPQSAELTIDRRKLINFASNDYLGLANHSALREAALKGIETYGVGSGASRLICGSLAPHHELEAKLASFKQCEAALTFSSGYATAIGTICALVGKDDIVVLDKLVHASIVDAARLSGAKIRVFAHNDLEDLESILNWAEKERANREKKPNVLIVTESIFSMDGDAAPLQGIVELKEKYGAWLMVDEAHSTGVLGNQGRGLADALGANKQIEVQMGTLGKAIGTSGGYICGSRLLIDYLINRARSFIFSTAPAPSNSAAAIAALDLIQREEGDKRRAQLIARIAQFRTRMKLAALPIQSPIIPVLIGDETAAVHMATALRAKGFFVPAIRFPTVARGSARLRVSLSASHTSEEVDQLSIALCSMNSSTEFANA